MARLVEIIGVTHNPFLPKQFKDDRTSNPAWPKRWRTSS